MTYFLGLIIIGIFTFLARRICRIFGISVLLQNFLFFNLHYLAYGFVLWMFFPDNFTQLFEKMMGPVLIFCLSWIGVYYGCSLEKRIHQKYSAKTMVFHIIEPVIIVIFSVLAGICYVYVVFHEIMYLDIVFIVSLFSSITLFKKHVILGSEPDYDFYPVINDLVPVRNIFAIAGLGILFTYFYGAGEFVLFGNHFTGLFSFIVLHIIIGLTAGVIFNMLLGESHTTDAMSTILIGVTALTGGIAYSFSLSPLFIGTISGAFLINSTRKRLQIIETLSISHEYIKKIFMFLLGALLSSLIQAGSLNIWLILGGAFGIFVLRSFVKYVLASLWVSLYHGYSRGTSLLWMGLTGQGIVAAGAAMEFQLHIPQLTSVFLLLIILMILNQTVIGVVLLKNRH